MPYKDIEKRKEYNNRYKTEHRELVRASSKLSYEKNKESILLKRAIKRSANRDKFRSDMRLYGEVYRRNHKAQIIERKRLKREINPDYFRNYDRDWRKKNKDKVTKYRQEHDKRHPDNVRSRHRRREALMIGARTGEINWQEIIMRDKGRCQICRGKVNKKDVSFDHIVPLSLGGSHTQDNLQLAHFSCNSRRGPGRIPAQTRILG